MNILRILVGQGLLTLLLCSVLAAEENPIADGTFYLGEQFDHSAQKDVLDIHQEVLQQLDDAERDWYRRFQEGIMFFDGWSSISQEILSIYPEELVEEKKQMIQRLGVKIGAEWCKDNEIRKIDNEMLRSWGDKIRASVAQGPEMTTQALIDIEYEVDALLKNEGKVTQLLPQS